MSSISNFFRCRQTDRLFGLFLWLLIIVLITGGAQADPLIVPSTGTDIDPSDHIQILEDATSLLTFEDVWRQEYVARFAPVKTATPALGGLRGAVWARFDLVNTIDQTLERLLVLDMVYYRSLSVYIEAPDGSLRYHHLSSDNPKRDVERWWLSPIFALPLAHGVTRVWIKTEYHAVTLGVHLRTPIAQAEFEGRIVGLYVATITLLALIVLGSLAFILTTGSLNYLPLTVWISTAIIGDLAGFGALRLFFDEPIVSYGYLFSTVEIITISFFWFFRRFLSLPQRFPAYNNLCLAYQAFLALQFCVLVWDPAIHSLIVPWGAVLFFAVWGLNIHRIGWRSREGLILIAGMLPMIISGEIATLILGGRLAQNLLVMAWVFGLQCVSAVIFSLGVAMQVGNKIRLAQAALKASESQLQANNLDLENQVEARTRHLKETQAQLAQAEKMASLGTLVAGVAHELNTPMGVALTTASKMDRDQNQLFDNYQSKQMTRETLELFFGNTKEGFSILLSNLRRAADLVRSFKQVAVDQHVEDKRQIDLRAYTNDILLSINPIIRRKGIRIVHDIPENLLITLAPGVLAQILTNLIQNAVLHAFDAISDPCVTISVVSDGEKIKLVVADNGVGMTDEVQNKAFDPFFTTKRGEGGGTGLGLHIVHNLVTEALKGSVELSSVLGHGTEFIITLNRSLISAQ